jgi:hypothetical protein
MSSLTSKIVGLNPWARRYLAATIPDGPPPISATVRLSVGCLSRFRSKWSPTPTSIRRRIFVDPQALSFQCCTAASNSDRPPCLIGAAGPTLQRFGLVLAEMDCSTIFPSLKECIGREIRTNCPRFCRPDVIAVSSALQHRERGARLCKLGNERLKEALVHVRAF